MRLSNRDIVILIGIAVAVVVTLTMLVYRDNQPVAKPIETNLPKKTSLHKAASTVIDRVMNRVSLH